MQPAHDTRREDNSAANPWGLPRARVLSLVSQKGGVAKTTSTVNLGAAFALSGHRVLVVGTDPQCGVSRSLGFTPEGLHGGLTEVLLSGLPLAQVAHATDLDGLSMVVPDAWSLAEEQRYKRALADEADVFLNAVDEARDDWDTILIDCPPGFGPETRAALTASDGFLVPVQAEELCRDSLRRLLEFVAAHDQATGRATALEGFFLTMTDHRTRLSRHVAEAMDREYGERLLDTSIPRNTRLAEMALQGRPTVIYDRLSSGSRAYFNLADEIQTRWLRRPADERTARRPSPRPVRRAPDPDVDARAHGTEAVEDDTVLSGLSRFMQALAGDGPARPAPNLAHDSGAEWDDDEDGDDPDLLSLDDLLDEEESRSLDRRREWGLGEDDYDTIN